MNPGELPETKRIARLIIGYLNNDLTPQEKQDLNEWIAASTENMELFETLTDEDHIDESMKWFRQLDDQVKLHPVERRSNKRIWIRVAAAAAVILLLGLSYKLFIPDNSGTINDDKVIAKNDILPGNFKATLITASGEKVLLGDTTRDIDIGNNLHAHQEGQQLSYLPGSESSDNILSVPANGLYKLKLADGTVVWLNASSVLHYPTSFNGQERRVELEGEAYFEVAANKSQPFRVAANKTLIEVLGTSFNVKNYADEPHQAVTLIQGSVNVTGNKRTVQLQPGDEGIITGDNDLKVVHTEGAEEKILWTKGLFSFRKTPIEEVMRTLSRWYNVQVVYKIKPDRQFTGNIPMKSDIHTALQMLELSGKVHLTLSGRTITVHP